MISAGERAETLANYIIGVMGKATSASVDDRHWLINNLKAEIIDAEKYAALEATRKIEDRMIKFGGVIPKDIHDTIFRAGQTEMRKRAADVVLKSKELSNSALWYRIDALLLKGQGKYND